MGRSYRKLIAVVSLLLAFIFLSTVSASAPPALAAHVSVAGSEQVSAAILPVRFILLDSQNKIIEITSNTSQNVTPTVYKNTFDGQPVALSQAIQSQYNALLPSLNISQAGVIYNAGPSLLHKVTALFGYQSILFRSHL